MAKKKLKIIGSHSSNKDVVKIKIYDQESFSQESAEIIKTHRTHSFKSAVFEDMYFVDSKYYLVACLALYVISLFAVDYFADSAAFFIRNELLHLKSGFFLLKRLFLWDFVVQIGLFAIFGSLLAKSPSVFFCLISYKKFDDESLWISFLRVFWTCFISSIALLILCATTQGLLYWMPEFIFNCYLQYVDPDKFFKLGYSEAQYASHFGWLKSFNLSLIFIFFIRIGVITTILQGLLLRDRRFKLTNPFIIIAVLLPFILSASMFLKPQEYKGATEFKLHNEEASDSQAAPSAKSADIDSSEEIEPSERPKAHITVYDSSTGIIRTNDKQQ